MERKPYIPTNRCMYRALEAIVATSVVVGDLECEELVDCSLHKERWIEYRLGLIVVFRD